MRNYDDNSNYEVNYIFQLKDAAGEVLDETSLVENNPTHATFLFMDEFGWGTKLGEDAMATIELVDFDDPDLYDDENNFELSSVVREDDRRICVADPKDKEDVKQLKLCPMFEYEDDYEDDGRNIVCSACWALGFKSVCERKPKEVE